MNRSRHAPAVTSLPQSPQDEATGRVRRYVLTMVIRMACFALTIFVTPYGWYTWVFAIATAVLPYIAVVFANAISPTASPAPESATQELSATVRTAPAEPTDANTITIHETPHGENTHEEKPDDDRANRVKNHDDRSGEA
ncbi:DUF3099 domain-containing protein [Microbacterium murale]|uniref:DUF3099 domain-containing protein n=1 Tax=Microbacterium murale TaxID=1081040 RepID=A0ABQ1RVJ8_9MICO|nr:DUF3099 domain-containing protein [Microbacterium murale]GGD79394.1 hypothetical protein GCM10007269_22790 [Microbacterium murale]